jgi:penicillin-binding protein 1A
LIAKFFRFLFKLGLVLAIVGGIAGASVGVYYYFKLTKDLPQIDKISDYRPQAVTTILAKDGTLLAELYEQRRYPATFEEIPLVVRNAFLAAEDANFYQHPGVDIISIARAAYVNIRFGRSKQGASTITQQIVKSLLLTRQKTLERKAKEAILAYRLEKKLTKDEILTIYLNEIFLGSTAYGVRAAARVHFRKELNELNIAESAYLAGLPQKPSFYAKKKNRPHTIRRQRYVLQQMYKNGMITKDEYQEAIETRLKIYPAISRTIFAHPYFTSYAIQKLDEVLRTVEGHDSAVSPGGLVVRTTLDIEAQKLAEAAVVKGLREVDKRRGWRGPITHLSTKDRELFIESTTSRLSSTGLQPGVIYKALVRKVNRRRQRATVQVGPFVGTVSFAKAKWAQRLIREDYLKDVDEDAPPKPAFDFFKAIRKINVGSVIEVSLQNTAKEPFTDATKKVDFKLNQTPELQAALASTNSRTGELRALVGGYDFSKSQFNRATQGKRQPGSSFKPFIYVAAIDDLGYTPATTVPDSPIKVEYQNGDIWEPKNYDRKYLGPITLRTALQRSRNVVSVFLIQQIGIDRAIQSARSFGITTPLGQDLSLSLGTSEVHLYEMVRAYGAFGNEGWLADELLISSIVNRVGETIYEQFPKQHAVLSAESAFLMANTMKGVVERGTAQRVKAVKHPVAGKTGTTNSQMDAWFIGYTPTWTTGVWVGFDVKKPIGHKETGGRAAGPIFVYYMKPLLKDQPKEDFEPPIGVSPEYIDVESGLLSDPSSRWAFLEYFKKGTQPTKRTRDVEANKDYLSSEEF